MSVDKCSLNPKDVLLWRLRYQYYYYAGQTDYYPVQGFWFQNRKPRGGGRAATLACSNFNFPRQRDISSSSCLLY